MAKTTKEHIYFVKGMHCASCEILIEKELLTLPGVKSVDASVNKGEILIEYEGERPAVEKLNRIFKENNYTFSEKPITARNNSEKNGLSVILGTSALLIIGFIILNKFGLSGLVSVNSKSSLPMFFILGILAGISTCAALVGGLVLSMSKQWLQIYSDSDSFFQKLQPHLMFNSGRLLSYTFFGAVLGVVGQRLQISLRFTSILVVAVSVMMVFLAFQMLGVKAFRRFQLTLPKFITRYIAKDSNFHGYYMPFLMGTLTFLLPCGFTITAQGLALISGSALQGSLIMLFFALGTLPALLFVGISSVKFSQKPHLSYKFLKVAGVLILFFALFNINSQLNVLGLPSFSNLGYRSQPITTTQAKKEGLPPIVNGKQIIKMDASSSGYKPNYFKVKVGIPVRWEITDKGTSGCTNAVISRSLFDGEISLTPGKTSIKEFTPAKTGKYKFSCWMGMVSGVIEVVDENNNGASAASASDNNNDVIPSGSTGCGCGGGSGSGSRCSIR